MKADTWIALFAFILSVVALFAGECQYKTTSEFNKRQLELTIQHDKLSVKPALNFETNVSITFKKVGIALKNKGIGPALIVNQKIYYSGIKHSNLSDLTTTIEKDGLRFWKTNEPEWYNFDSLTLSPLEELDLYHVDLSNLSNLSNAIQALGKITIFYEYTDIYNDTFKIDYNRSLVKDSFK